MPSTTDVATSLTSCTTIARSPFEADTENVRSFGSFDDWLASFSPIRDASAKTPNQLGQNDNSSNSSELQNTVRSHLSKTSKLLITVKNLTGSSPSPEHSLHSQETMELDATDFLYKGIRLLQDKGTQDS